MRAQTAREIRQGVAPLDERDAAIQRGAEQQAFRVLKIVLPIFLVGYWVACFCFPVGPTRITLIISAITMTLLTMFVLVLPNAIRQWMEPDEVSEPMAVEREA